MDNAYFRQPPSPRSLQLSPPTRLSAAAAVRASFGPSLSAGRQLVLLLPHSHTPKPPICAGAVRIHKAAAMTGLDSTPSLSTDPTARPPDPADHLLLHTRAELQPRIESRVLRCLAIFRCLEIRDDCLRVVVSTCCTNHACSANRR